MNELGERHYLLVDAFLSSFVVDFCEKKPRCVRAYKPSFRHHIQRRQMQNSTTIYEWPVQRAIFTLHVFTQSRSIQKKNQEEEDEEGVKRPATTTTMNERSKKNNKTTTICKKKAPTYASVVVVRIQLAESVASNNIYLYAMDFPGTYPGTVDQYIQDALHFCALSTICLLLMLQYLLFGPLAEHTHTKGSSQQWLCRNKIKKYDNYRVLIRS